MNKKVIEKAAANYSANITAQTHFIAGVEHGISHYAALKDANNNHDDRLYVSAEPDELEYVARKFGCESWQVLKVKQENKLVLRSEVYQYLEHELKA